MSKFKDWYSLYYDEITWFIIGWLSFAFLDNLLRGQYVWALLDAVFIYGNYKLSQR